MAAFSARKSTLPWPHSKHNVSPSLAIDVAPYPVVWSDLHRFREFAAVVKECAARFGIGVEWGGDWVHYPDYPHWQLRLPR